MVVSRGTSMAQLRHRFWKFVEMGIDPYLTEYRFQITAFARDVKEKYSHLGKGEESEDIYRLAGRILALRRHGKIVFAVLDDGTDRIQLVLKHDVLGEERWKLVEALCVGDIVGVEGNPMRTLRGELSILVKDLRILALTWREYPEKWHGLSEDKRYRLRYLDMMLNERVRKAIEVTYRIEKFFRDYLDSLGFIEIHTPKLQPIYGGALARPFTTRMYALDNKVVYLSIAPETYLKRAVVANFFRVYEISVCFRNEDIDAQHYPEFVQIEIYQAFADWNDMMRLVEDMVSKAVKQIFGSYVVELRDGRKIDFSPPWKRIGLEEAIESIGGVKVRDKDIDELRKLAEDLGIKVDDPRRGKILEKLFEKLVVPKIVDPTFVTLFPRDVSPLARPFRKDPRYAERFEIYINGLEVGNGYSELNNPIVQFYFFKKEEELRAKAAEKFGGEIEYHPMDRDYVRALEYGMPPTAGVGIGIYRLVMAILGLPSIKDVIPFTIVEPDDSPTIAEMHNDILRYYIEKLELDKF